VTILLPAVAVGVVVLVILAIVSLAVLREYERGVVFRMGHARPCTNPGWCC